RRVSSAKAFSRGQVRAIAVRSLAACGLFSWYLSFLLDVNVITEKDVRGALHGVLDPELRAPITDLGMVTGVAIDGSNVVVSVALTTAGCPLRAQIKDSVESKLRGLPGIGTVR